MTAPRLTPHAEQYLRQRAARLRRQSDAGEWMSESPSDYEGMLGEIDALRAERDRLAATIAEVREAATKVCLDATFGHHPHANMVTLSRLVAAVREGRFADLTSERDARMRAEGARDERAAIADGLEAWAYGVESRTTRSAAVLIAGLIRDKAPAIEKGGAR